MKALVLLGEGLLRPPVPQLSYVDWVEDRQRCQVLWKAWQEQPAVQPDWLQSLQAFPVISLAQQGLHHPQCLEVFGSYRRQRAGRPDVVWDGEPLLCAEQALEWLAQCQNLLLIGDWPDLLPVSEWPSLAKQAHRVGLGVSRSDLHEVWQVSVEEALARLSSQR
jgi:hypothetical protein